MKELFVGFKKKLLLENFLKALLFAVLFSSALLFLASLIYHILVVRMTAGVAWLIAAISFVLAFALCFAFGYPAQKKIASRIDQLGLLERVGTMLEYQNVDTYIANLQRRDAKEHLQKVTPKQMKFALSRNLIKFCAISLCFALVMMLLPYDVFSLKKRSSLGEENEVFVKELLEQLRQEVKQAELDALLSEELEQILEELEEELKDSESELEQAAKIEEAKKEMEERLEKELTKNPIGQALQQYDLTKPLGEAIENADEEGVKFSLDTLEKAVQEDLSVREALSQTVFSALSQSGAPESDKLYQALFLFATSLFENTPETDTYEDAMIQTFDDAKRQIIEALREQEQVEMAKDSLDKTLNEAKKEALGKQNQKEEEETSTKDGQGSEDTQETQTDGGGDKENATEEDKGQQNNSENKKPSSHSPGGSGSGSDSNSSSSSQNEMTEQIFDPVSGKVAYGKVFALYYAEYLAALEKGEVDPLLQEIIDRYFTSLN